MKESSNRFSEIDSLRGVAAISVFLYHLLPTYGREFDFNFSFSHYFDFGFYGVELFFIISGFVIFYSINKSRSAKEFLIKRFVRLYPTYWLCLILTFVIVQWVPLSAARNTTFLEALANVTMLNGLFQIKPVDPSYWSLLIEISFYALMTIVLLSNNIKRIYPLISLWLVLIIFYNQIFQIPGLGFLFNLRYGPLFIAGICFYKMKVERDFSYRSILLLMLSYLCSMIVLWDLDNIVMAISIIYLLFSLAIFSGSRLFQAGWLLFVGGISYPFYLIHQNIGFVIMNVTRDLGYTSPVIFLIPVFICGLLAWLITRFFEKPVMTYLHKILLSPSKHGRTTAALAKSE